MVQQEQILPRLPNYQAVLKPKVPEDEHQHQLALAFRRHLLRPHKKMKARAPKRSHRRKMKRKEPFWS